jgi:Cytochrome bd terminal oxidase subunit II
MQGMMIGALVEGLPMSGGRYIGGEFDWLSLFAVLCGLGLCFGYALLGACWLLKKYENTFRERVYRTIPHITGGLLGFFVFLLFYVLVDMHVLLRWLERPYLLVCPAIGILSVFLLAVTVRHQLPFYTAAAIFAAAFGTLAISLWPYMIPFSGTIDAAAVPLSGLASKVWTGALVFGLIVAYVLRNYAVSRADVCQILATIARQQCRQTVAKGSELLPECLRHLPIEDSKVSSCRPIVRRRIEKRKPTAAQIVTDAPSLRASSEHRQPGRYLQRFRRDVERRNRALAANRHVRG